MYRVEISASTGWNLSGDWYRNWICITTPAGANSYGAWNLFRLQMGDLWISEFIFVVNFSLHLPFGSTGLHKGADVDRHWFWSLIYSGSLGRWIHFWSYFVSTPLRGALQLHRRLMLTNINFNAQCVYTRGFRVVEPIFEVISYPSSHGVPQLQGSLSYLFEYTD